MEVTIIAGDIAKYEADAIIVGAFEDELLAGDLANIDKLLDGNISRLIDNKEIKGKAEEITLIHTLGKLPAARVAVVGLGKKPELNLDKVRDEVARTLRLLRQKGAERIATAALGNGVAGISAESAVQAITEGALLGTYTFRKHITKAPEHGEIKQLSIVCAEKKKITSLESARERGRIVSEATNLARDMVNEPANYKTPTVMAEEATKLAKSYGLEITVLEREQMQELGMGALLGVAQGSRQPPKFIIIQYHGKDTKEPDIVLAGKGITFDSGGISIKPSEGMGDMKGDMAGGAAVMLTMTVIAQLKPRLNVTGLIPATENMPGGAALKPADIVTALNGKTIEIISTDAEGRLILADALSYANKIGAKRIIDIATLTGACVVALGEICSGAFGNNQELIDRVLAAGKDAGERIWQMPMFEDYKEQNKSDVADIKNSGGRWGGAITAAQFLAEFAGGTPWVHLDIAGTNMTDKERGHLVKGATGVMVRTLVNLVSALAAEQK